MKNFKLENLIRDNVLKLKPYSSARHEFTGVAEVFLDANENPFENGHNRYPDAYQRTLKKKISQIKGLPIENIFLGNGSDEVIDLIFRAFCDPNSDNILICPPTYGMYEVSANINAIAIKKVLLLENFQLDLNAIFQEIDSRTKLIFICSPNNPTGNSMQPTDVEYILKNFDGLVVVDEAYIDFSTQTSFSHFLDKYPNLVVLQTFSKAWGLAGIRLGMGLASVEIVTILNKIKPPYNVNTLTQQTALKALENTLEQKQQIKSILTEREKLNRAFEALPFVQKIYPSDANFLLLKTDNPNQIYNDLKAQKIIIRNRSNVELCEGCLRITIGTTVENDRLINALQNL